uniref:Uncharacterized protein n=1 Tax=Anguilla anguilla TaxID=7936 RepID=A0A0E9Q174_ANGAN
MISLGNISFLVYLSTHVKTERTLQKRKSAWGNSHAGLRAEPRAAPVAPA